MNDDEYGIIGRNTKDAIIKLKKERIKCRISSIDDRAMILTRDLDVTRINLKIQNDIVISYYKG